MFVVNPIKHDKHTHFCIVKQSIQSNRHFNRAQKNLILHTREYLNLNERT